MGNLEKFEERVVLKKYEKNIEWKDFSLKINYLYKVLFKEDKEKLIAYFSDMNGFNPKKNRKKTIDNWLKGESKKPNGFHLTRFKISEYKFSNGEPLFTIESFKSWSIKTFKARIDDYLYKSQLDYKSLNTLKYIYYFNVDNKQIDKYTITYTNPNNHKNIEISSPRLIENMTYKGEIFEYHNMLYIFTKNDYDHMIYILENSANVFQQTLKVYGTGLCKDYATKQPKAYMALFSSKELTQTEQCKFQHKLNNSNLLIAQNFNRSSILEEDYLFENFYTKIHDLGKDLIPHYQQLSTLNKNFNDVLVKEFKSYLSMLKKASQNFDFFITNRRKLQIYSLESISEKFDTGAVIVYTLNKTTLPFFFEILNNQEESIYLNNVYIKYLLIIENKELLTPNLINKLKKLEEKNVNIKFISENHSYYSEFLLVIDTNFAIYRMGKEIVDNTFVTKNIKKIDGLYDIYSQLEKKSLSLKEFLDTQCILNGKWYSYSYGSRSDSSHYHTVPIKIQNNYFKAEYATGAKEGVIHQTSKQTTLIVDGTIIKIINSNIDKNIFRVSIIGQEIYLHHHDVLLYGIMSREALSNEEVHLLLDALHVKDGSQFRLKISDSFDRILAEFKAKKYNLYR